MTAQTRFDPDILSGKTVGQYEIDRLIGSGAFSHVFLARHRILRRRVALKVLRHQGVHSAKTFEREAQTLARMDHRHVVRIHDAGLEGPYMFIAMEFLENGCLEARLTRTGRASAQEAVTIAAQTLLALEYIHAKGVIHRDLKPTNLLLSKEQEIRLADFGLVKLLEATTVALGAILGTPAYMSPEQLRGQTLDARSDLYSLGVVLYRALSGRTPFPGKTPEDLRRVVEDEPAPPLRSSRDDIPPALAEFVDRLLRRNPDERHSSARSALGELDQLARNGPGIRPAPARSARPELRPKLRMIVCPRCSLGFHTGRLHAFRCPNAFCGHEWKTASLSELAALDAESRIPLPVFLVIRGPDEGRFFDLPEGRFLVGRHPRAAVRLADTAVSIHHAALEREGTRVVVEKGRGETQVLVNGRPPTNLPLRVGDVLLVGTSALLLQLRFAPRHDETESGPRPRSAKRTETLVVKVRGEPADGFPLEEERITIGRERGRDVQLLHRAVSRRHAIVTRELDGVHLSDCGSHAGTFVNGEPITKRRLATDDEIRIGPFLLYFDGAKVTWIKGIRPQ
ncbi:MAG: protein kinase [Planctomycetota bacterium]